MIVENIEDNDLLNIEIDDEIGTDKEIIGTFVKNTAKLSIKNTNHQYDDLKDKYINIKNFGRWFVYDLVNNEDATEAQLSLYDISNKFDEEYNVELYSFPCTFGEWATKIGEVVGLPLEGTFLNYNLEVKEAPFLGTNPSNRDAVKFIAKHASGYAQINLNDTYSIKWFDKTIYEIEDWESFAHGNESKEVNIVVLSTGDTGDNECWPQSKPEDPHEIKIVDDWTNIDRTTIIEDIYNQLRGFKYTPITKLEVPYGLLELRAGQMIKAQDIELKYITTYISSHKLTWDGGDFDDSNSWSSSIKMMEISETSSKYTYSGSIINRLTRTERTVDKQNQIIKDVVESTDEAVSKVNEFEMSLDGIKMSVDETNKKFDKEIVTKKSANGNPIEIDDAGEYPLESILIEGKSYQPIALGEIKTIRGKEIEDRDGRYLKQIAIGINHFDGNLESGAYSTITGAKIGNASMVRNANPIPVLNKYEYIFSNNSVGVAMNIYEYDIDFNFLGHSVVSTSSSFRPQEQTKYLNFHRSNSSVDKIQLNLGNEILPYEEYKENIALIDMNIYGEEGKIIGYHEFASLNDSKDKFLDGLFAEKIGKAVFNGNENWNLTSSYEGYLRFSLVDGIASYNSNKAMNNRFAQRISQAHGGYEYVYLQPNTNVVYVQILPSRLETTDISGFKKYLSENQLKLYYELEKYRLYELSYDQLKLHKGYNYITLNDDLYPSMEIEYLTDSVLNATYETKAEHRIENDKIISELNSKVTDNELGEAITEINNTFEQKISDSEASTMNSVNAKFKDYSTTKEMDASIKSAVDENNAIIDLSVSQKIEDIQIGGTNLVLDSEKERTISKGGIETSNRIDVTPGEVLAISFDVKGASEYNGNIALIEQYVDDTTTTRHSYKWITGTVKTYYERIKYLYTVPKDVYSIDFGYRSYSVVNTFRKLKIERGNKFTDWDAAPKDKADTKEVTAQLELKVGKNDNDQVVSMLNASAQEINLTSNRFSMKSDYSSINKNGTVDFKGGKVGGFNFDSQSISKDITVGGKTYRIYIQSYLENSKTDTWAFSTQISNDAGSFDGTAGIKYNGDIFCQNLEVINDLQIFKNLSVIGNINDVRICSPYGYGNRITPVQYSSYKSGESTLASGTYNYIGGMTLGAGKYIAFVEVVFGSNKNGIRAINLSTTENYSTPQYTVPAVNGAATRFWYAVPLVLTKDTTYYINAYQNSGSNLSVWGNLYVFDIQSNV